MACECLPLVKGMKNVADTCIARHCFFEGLDANEKGTVIQKAFRKKCNKNEVIFHQGDLALKMFLIKAGRIKLTKFSREGGEVTLDIRKAGDYIGESIFYENLDPSAVTDPRSDAVEYPVTAKCLESTVICGLTTGDFKKAIMQHPQISLLVIKNLTSRLLALEARVESMAATSLEDKLYRVLVNVAREHGEVSFHGAKIRFPLTHEELSFLVGAHRVSITRALKNLKAAGLIITDGKTLILSKTSGATM